MSRHVISLFASLSVLGAGLALPAAAAAGTDGFSPRGIPLAGQVLFGSASTADIAGVEAWAGRSLGIHRSYFQASQVTAAVDRARADLAAGRVPWVSFKAPASWASMVAGGGDAWARDVAARLGALSGPVWVAVHHEPEGDGVTADWVAMQRRLSPIFRAHPNIAFSIILMGWNQFYGSNSDQTMAALWPGKDYLDIVGFDPYNWYDTTNGSSGKKSYTWTELRDYYTKIRDWLASTGNSSVRWAIAETGYTDSAAALPASAVAPNGKVVSAAGPGSQWLTRAYDDMKAMGGIALSYFDVAASVNGEPSDWTWPLAGNPKRATFTSVLARSERLGDPAVVTPSATATPQPTPPTVSPTPPTATPQPTSPAATPPVAATPKPSSPATTTPPGPRPTRTRRAVTAATLSSLGVEPTTTVRVRPAARSGRIVVNVGPNLKGKAAWRFRVERQRADGTWHAWRTLRTRGHSETRVVNPKAGTYRVVVLPARGRAGGTSSPITVLR